MESTSPELPGPINNTSSGPSKTSANQSSMKPPFSLSCIRASQTPGNSTVSPLSPPLQQADENSTILPSLSDKTQQVLRNLNNRVSSPVDSEQIGDPEHLGNFGILFPHNHTFL